ncbi:MAG: hypothetical protein LBJ81_01990 [Puniceicoccales bacterium]|nr:hypothetical protein [Puniceicoccales bacterium]
MKHTEIPRPDATAESSCEMIYFLLWCDIFLTKPGGVGIIFFIICAAVSLKIYETHRNSQARRTRRIVL